MDLTKLDAHGAYEILIAINRLRSRLRAQDHAAYSRELREFAFRHGIEVGLLRAMVELTMSPITLPVRES
jgi:hypothetical protein